MNIEKANTGHYAILFQDNEKELLLICIDTTLEELDVQLQELSTRTGFQREEFLKLRENLENQPGNLEMTLDEVTMLNQVFNEVCNGFNVKKYDPILTQRKGDLVMMLKQVHYILAESRNNNGVDDDKYSAPGDYFGNLL